MTDERPLDYGDQNPSDIGDVPPVSRIGGFSESEFSVVNPSKTVSTRARPPRQANPNAQEAKKTDLHLQDAYTGVLIQRVDAETWIVLRQDGFRVTAKTSGDYNVYQEYKIGETCSLTRGPGASNSTSGQSWFMSADSKNKELSSMQVTNTGDISFKATTTVDMARIITQSGSLIESDGSGLVVKADKAGLYQIHYKITALCTDPDDDSADIEKFRVQVSAGCFGVFSGTSKILTPARIDFRRNVGFRVGDDAINGVAQVTLNISESEYAPQSPLGGDDVIWTDEPHYGNSLVVGSKVSQGWIKIRCTGESHLWLGHGDKSLKLRFPNKDPVFAGHLVANGLGGAGCTQLKWSKAGGKGEMAIVCSYCSLDKTWKVEDGLVISGPGIEAPSQSDGEQAVCTETTRGVWSCSEP